jgi:trehalose 6-phosphate phosphatase
MMPETVEKLEEFFAAVRGARRSILLLDYDGSLAPFRVNRFRARPYAGVSELLERIRTSGKTKMAVITGRPAQEIAPMLGLGGTIEVWGLHGAERIHSDGRHELERSSPVVLEKLEDVRQRLKRDAFGGLFEDKANGAVMHWRGLPAAKARIVEEKSRRLFEPLTRLDGLRMLDFECGVELRAGRDKGGAVEAILEESAQSDGEYSPVAYLGDDLTDEAAFRAVNASRAAGMSVLMRRAWRKTDAAAWLRPPDELRGFLKRWVDAVEA